MIEIQPWENITWKNKIGKVLDHPCQHPQKIPGLDGEGCPVCRIWWLDDWIHSKWKTKNTNREDGDQ